MDSPSIELSEVSLSEVSDADAGKNEVRERLARRRQLFSPKYKKRESMERKGREVGGPGSGAITDSVDSGAASMHAGVDRHIHDSADVSGHDSVDVSAVLMDEDSLGYTLSPQREGRDVVREGAGPDDWTEGTADYMPSDITVQADASGEGETVSALESPLGSRPLSPSGFGLSDVRNPQVDLCGDGFSGVSVSVDSHTVSAKTESPARPGPPEDTRAHSLGTHSPGEERSSPLRGEVRVDIPDDIPSEGEEESEGESEGARLAGVVSAVYGPVLSSLKKHLKPQGQEALAALAARLVTQERIIADLQIDAQQKYSQRKSQSQQSALQSTYMAEVGHQVVHPRVSQDREELDRLRRELSNRQSACNKAEARAAELDKECAHLRSVQASGEGPALRVLRDAVRDTLGCLQRRLSMLGDRLRNAALVGHLDPQEAISQALFTLCQAAMFEFSPVDIGHKAAGSCEVVDLGVRSEGDERGGVSDVMVLGQNSVSPKINCVIVSYDTATKKAATKVVSCPIPIGERVSIHATRVGESVLAYSQKRGESKGTLYRYCIKESDWTTVQQNGECPDCEYVVDMFTLGDRVHLAGGKVWLYPLSFRAEGGADLTAVVVGFGLALLALLYKGAGRISLRRDKE
ncbi:hypothetical protein KIPB_004071 [Kipferlia bialata]|uniref:Uncharacterized protein n=1 Tax=Kipferlia bialata TaxID=797122 RepID=A0A9K3CUR5_9EUKA|nr:hypothetical protein KIPB_004071 [Kipferlia bialata]|eukprot:g4071.t1